ERRRPSMCPLPLWERAARTVSRTLLGEGFASTQKLSPRRDTAHPALRATFSRIRLRQGFGGHEGRREDSNYTGVKNGNGAPSVGLNPTFTFCPIFSVVRSQSTKIVWSDGPSFSVT